ncbi:hypothetical protein [Romboutsia sp. 1001216sp1]|nr:hypothetical protein [Romboutsia sp. 1001216sp1]MDB8809235.1 hypothetical protein [Romboutsia sp. 1001216sp1]MDB8814983.1 hypothetical protein [Romboutsia sp. 1001216sp1]MDB8819716.1 hypothetical protein [Romboutsia sp. 1001216sp1]MDB8822453.1 hypothetical protein [Romboutsia sp. 1001216sp1]
MIKEIEVKHRWEIAHRGHCKWFYPNHEENIIEIFFDLDSEYNIEKTDSYTLDYDSKWYNLFEKLVNKEGYIFRIWKKAEKRGYWYVEDVVGVNLINVEEDKIEVTKNK